MVYREAPVGENELRQLYREHCRRLSRASLEHGALPMTIYGNLRSLLEKSWCRETASPGSWGTWSPSKPEWGQCAVTALLVQTLCGGEITRTVVEGYGSHYANQLQNGEDVALYDLTKTQFPYAVQVLPGVPVERSYVLDSPRAVEARTKERYELLCQRFAQAIRNAPY